MPISREYNVRKGNEILQCSPCEQSVVWMTVAKRHHKFNNIHEICCFFGEPHIIEFTGGTLCYGDVFPI